MKQRCGGGEGGIANPTPSCTPTTSPTTTGTHLMVILDALFTVFGILLILSMLAP